jgi:hypothetical protein
MANVPFHCFFLKVILVTLMTVLPLAGMACLDQVSHSEPHAVHEAKASSCCSVLSAESDCCLKQHECPGVYSETVSQVSSKPLNLPDCPVVIDRMRTPHPDHSRVASVMRSVRFSPMPPLSASILILRI